MTKNVTHLLLDRERAEADAAQRGVVGAEFATEFQRFQDYWDSAGWKRKGGSVKDRNATWRTWLDSPFRAKSNGSGPATEAKGRAGLREWMASTDDNGRPLTGNVIEGELVR